MKMFEKLRLSFKVRRRWGKKNRDEDGGWRWMKVHKSKASTGMEHTFSWDKNQNSGEKERVEVGGWKTRKKEEMKERWKSKV